MGGTQSGDGFTKKEAVAEDNNTAENTNTAETTTPSTETETTEEGTKEETAFNETTPTPEADGFDKAEKVADETTDPLEEKSEGGE